MKTNQKRANNSPESRNKHDHDTRVVVLSMSEFNDLLSIQKQYQFSCECQARLMRSFTEIIARQAEFIRKLCTSQKY